MSSQHQQFYDAVRTANQNVWQSLHDLLTLQSQWDALDYSNTLTDGEGAHLGITKTELGAVTFATADAMKAVLDAGHATNMAKLLR